MPAGRPSSYDPTFCDQVIAHGRAGKSRAWIAASLGVVRQTIANWESEHPEFLDAMTHAGLLAQMWWEDKGQEGMERPGFSAPIWSRSMAARFPADWREKQEIEHSGTVNIADAVAAARARAAGIVE